MSINCIQCGNESKVVLTRRTIKTNHGKTIHNSLRTRQCLTCRWKWKTIERTFRPSKDRL